MKTYPTYPTYPICSICQIEILDVFDIYKEFWSQNVYDLYEHVYSPEQCINKLKEYFIYHLQSPEMNAKRNFADQFHICQSGWCISASFSKETKMRFQLLYLEYMMNRILNEINEHLNIICQSYLK